MRVMISAAIRNYPLLSIAINPVNHLPQLLPEPGPLRVEAEVGVGFELEHRRHGVDVACVSRVVCVNLVAYVSRVASIAARIGIVARVCGLQVSFSYSLTVTDTAL